MSKAYKLPQVVRFVDDEIKRVYSADMEEGVVNMKTITETLRLNRLVFQNVLFGHYKSLEGVDKDTENFRQRTLVILPLDLPDIREKEVNVLMGATEDDYSTLFFVRNIGNDLDIVDGSLYVDFTLQPGVKRLANKKTPKSLGIEQQSDQDVEEEQQPRPPATQKIPPITHKLPVSPNQPPHLPPRAAKMRPISPPVPVDTDASYETLLVSPPPIHSRPPRRGNHPSPIHGGGTYITMEPPPIKKPGQQSDQDVEVEQQPRPPATQKIPPITHKLPVSPNQPPQLPPRAAKMRPKLPPVPVDTDDSYETPLVSPPPIHSMPPRKGKHPSPIHDDGTYITIEPPPIKLPVDLSWKACLEKNSKNDAISLIEQGDIPNGPEFQQACILWRHSDTDLFKDICVSICKNIKDQSNDITSVHAAYKADNADNVVFVVNVVKEPHPDISEYNIEYRPVDTYSNEGRDVTEFEKREKKFFTDEEAKQLRECLQNNSTRLTKEHSNLNMIFACTFKSENYKTGREAYIPKTCIVFYVDFKGYIPIYEEPFETQLDGYPIDVREGSFHFFGPSDFHNQLKMGCQIGNNRSGTLGAFLDYKNNICCLTSAHVLLSKAEMLELTAKGELKWNFMDGPKVYQPNTNAENQKAENEYFGDVIQAVHRPGEGIEAGIEVALVAIYRRQPESGTFPMENTGGAGNMQFTSGQICYNSQFPIGTEVIMFGSVSGPRKGHFRFQGTGIKEKNAITMGDWSFWLNNQIVIESMGGEDFAPGDSGALVFVPFHGNNLDLRAFGIFEGQSTDGSYIVTPFWDILEALDHPKLMAFQRSAIEELMDSKMKELEQRIVQHLNESEQRLAEHLNQREQGLADQNEQRLSQHTQDIAQQIADQNKQQLAQFQNNIIAAILKK